MVREPDTIITDTGPLVAYLNKSDTFHSWAVEQFSAQYPPFHTCEAVLSEACFLLRNLHNGPRDGRRVIPLLIPGCPPPPAVPKTVEAAGRSSEPSRRHPEMA
jgi:hypothetical protein